MKYKLNSKDREVIRFVSKRLLKDGFNPKNWCIKEIPVEQEVYTFQNMDDAVEFSVFVIDDVKHLGYYVYGNDGSCQERYAHSVIECLEKMEMPKSKYHHGAEN
ncbi:hypothetical protein GNF18_10215 [Ligilactobacillus pobuzihii]|uniref:hypothetical protein n=1 Tax=Ligilactobacillus pobuzihii TaxID=449659 RepID=UPI0019CF865F|nr:hypothetical protein [Ligilactobacillus pobuzihii]MBN7275514.1 hypothetical protein [Ligilactobacillus pobuzihii]